MARVHLILQGKGGVGKSYVAFLLGQYFQDRGCKTLLIDTDPVNHTFASVASLGVETFDITNDGDVDQRSFDALFERVLSAPADHEIVIDNGSSGYVSMISYLIQNDTIGQLLSMGYEVYIHSLIVGGRDLRETLGNFDSMAQQLPSARHVVWLNHHLFGKVEYNGKSIRDSKTLSKYNGQIKSIVDLPLRKERLFGEDIRALMSANQTFAEGEQNTNFALFSRLRLGIVQKETWEALDASGLLPAQLSTTEGSK